MSALTFEHKSIEIECTGYGRFVARVYNDGDPVDINAESLREARDEIDRVLALTKTQRRKPSVPVFFFDGAELNPYEWRGFHAGNGRLMLTRQDGEKVHLKLPYFYPRGDKKLPPYWLVPAELMSDDLTALVGDYRAARDAAHAALDRLYEAVQEAGVPLPEEAYRVRGTNSAEEQEIVLRNRLDDKVRRARMHAA